MFEPLGALDVYTTVLSTNTALSQSLTPHYSVVSNASTTSPLYATVGFNSWRKRGNSKTSWSYITQQID